MSGYYDSETEKHYTTPTNILDPVKAALETVGADRDVLREHLEPDGHGGADKVTEPERHPLHALYASQNDAGEEQGVTVPCEAKYYEEGIAPPGEHVVHSSYRETAHHPDKCTCGGTNRILRDTDWPDGALVGWLSKLVGNTWLGAELKVTKTADQMFCAEFFDYGVAEQSEWRDIEEAAAVAALVAAILANEESY